MRNDLLKDFAFSFIGGNTFLWYSWRETDLIAWLFRFEELENSQITNVDTFDLKKNDYKLYDCVILDLPYGWIPNWRTKEIDITSYFIDHLHKDWLLFVWISEKDLKLFEKKWYKPYWLIEWGNFSFRYSNIKPILAIFKNDGEHKELFVSSFDKNTFIDIEATKKHFIEHTSWSSLDEWFFINRNEYISINHLKIREEIRNLRSEYKEFDMYKLEELWDIVSVDLQNDEKNCIYIPNIWNMEVVSSIFDVARATKNPENYFKVRLKTDIVTSEYLVNYFKSEIAQISLKWCLSTWFIPKISKSNLRLLEIPVVWMEMQEKINNAYKKLDEMKKAVAELESALSTSPKSVDKVLFDLNEINLKDISEEQKILSLIRQWEWLRLEFKKTFSKSVDKGKENVPTKEIRKSALKNIAWFMNNDGWTLLIWVADDWSIFWIENDNFTSNDDYLKTFKDVVKVGFTTENVIYLIKFYIVEVEWKKVLRVDCPSSKEMIYLKEGNDIDWAYVRTNPSVEKIKWPDLVNYAIKRGEDKSNNI